MSNNSKRRERPMATIIHLSVGDTLILKKPHPCGNSKFKVLRLGSDVKILCLQCGRDMTMERVKLERAIKQVISPTDNTDNN